MSIAFLGTNNATVGTTVVVTLAQAVAVGAFVVVATAAHDAGPDTLTDSKGNTWTQQSTAAFSGTGSSGSGNGALYTSQLTTALASGDTITLTKSSSLNGTLSAYAVNTSSGTLALDGAVQSASGSGTTATGPTAVAAAKTGEAYICFTCLENGQSPGLTAGDAGNGWTLDNISPLMASSSTSASITGIVSMSQIASNATGCTAAVPLNTTRPYVVFIVPLKF